jgi:alkylation response protein AidB-like acyl-CoA dehydrogenase
MGQNFYKRDSRDVVFVLKEQLGIERLIQYEAYKDFTIEDFDMILDQAMKIASNDIAPTFQDGDREGCRFNNGRVSVPESFHHCWNVFRQGGWFALSAKPDYGGQGLPLIVAEAAMEFLMSANFAFCCYSGMGAGSGGMIERYGTELQRRLFVRKMYDGTWSGSMCLTEPGVGSDAHMATVKAFQEDDHYLIQGTKIFITSGEHDLVENIIHLVIARIDGAPAGAKGVSLFAVPKILVNENGDLEETNDVACIGIEHKMGLKGSATCVMNFGENNTCKGYLIGEPGMGLAYMFDMVNIARMAVGLESVAFGANMYANCLAYAKERIQGTPFGKKGDRVRIVEHSDVRRMLMNMKALTEGMRALVYRCYFMEDMAKAAPSEEERKSAQRRVELLTPLVKAYCSDRIFEMGRDGIQILGGYGFTQEYPVEQYTRDCKILSIWDGTNYIQSVDLIGRKLMMEGGKVFQDWVDEIGRFIHINRSQQPFYKEITLLREALDTLVELSMLYRRYFKEGSQARIPLTSTRFLDCMAEVAIGHLLLEQGVIAADKLGQGSCSDKDSSFYQGKLETVRYFARNLLPQVFGRARIIRMEDTSAADIDENGF